jgi:mono/diheme cytochrome c family protein
VRIGSRWNAVLTAAALGVALLLGDASQGLAKSVKKKQRSKPLAPTDFDVKLPVLGTQLEQFPPGPGKSVADQACLQCHSASMAAQQRLNEKQWTASVEKMIRWGAAVPADKKDELVTYLLANFGPDNDRFQPTLTRPVGR